MQAPPRGRSASLRFAIEFNGHQSAKPTIDL